MGNRQQYIGIWSPKTFILLINVFNFDLVQTTTLDTDYEVRLIRDIISNHEPLARPVANNSDKVEVSIYMNIYELKEVDTKNQFISVIGWLGINWYDERLKWNSSEYGGIKMLAVYPQKIWVPTFVLGNTRAEYLYSEEWFSFYKVKIYSDGRIFWAPGGLFTANCQMDVRYFPFDDQICFFKFENWVYDGDSVNISYTDFAENTFLTYYDNTNGQFSIDGIKVLRRDVYFDSSPTPYPQVIFGLLLKRKSLFYIVNVVLTSLLFIALFLAAFKLHPQCGERISLGITLLLAFSIFVLMIQSSIPETSQNVPLIIFYLSFTMFLTSLGILESILVLHFHYHDGSCAPPEWLINIAIYNRSKKERRAEMYIKNIENEFDASRNKETDANGNLHKDQLDAEENPKLLLGEINERNVANWKIVAALIDKVSFWIFIFMYIILITVVCIIIPLSRPYKDLHNTMDWAGF